MVLAMLTSVVQSGGLTASPAQIPFYHPILLTYRFAFVELLKDSWDVFTAFSSVSSTDEVHPETHVLCLGLGSPIASQNARVQLAFLAETCTLLNVVCRLRYPLSVCGGPPIIIHLPFFLLLSHRFSVGFLSTTLCSRRMTENSLKRCR